MDVPASPKPKRRFRPRFRLRTFLVLVTLFCVWLGWHIHGVRRQREVVEAIRACGGEVFYDYQETDGSFGEYFSELHSQVPLSWRESLGEDFFHAVAYVRIPSTPAEAGQIKRPSIDQIAHLSKLVHLSLEDWTIDDDDLKQIGRLKRLRHLVIGNGIDVSDAGVAHLRRLRELRSLFLRNSRITDASLEVFSRMSELRNLDLLLHRFNGEGVIHLRRLKKLENLTLIGLENQPSEITDDALLFLLDLPHFNELNVRHTRVTQEFAEKTKTKFYVVR